jgi:hypothetical protein
MGLQTWNSDLLQNLAHSPWSEKLQELIESVITYGQDFFREHWAIVWIVAIVIGLWCLSGCTRRQAH